MSSTAFNASFVKNHKAKSFFEPDGFIAVTVLVSPKAKFENSKCCVLKTKNAMGPKTGKRSGNPAAFILHLMTSCENTLLISL